MNNANVFFFSANCEASQLLWSLMQKEGLDIYFTSVCTDNNLKIPNQITMTPSLIIKGSKLYVANDAFVWLAKMKEWKTRVLMQTASDAQKEHLKSINKNLTNNDDEKLLGFSKTEMDGVSDPFSYLKDENASVPHTYFEFDNIGKEYIFTPPLENGSYRLKNSENVKLKSDKSLDLMKKMNAERKKQEQEYKGAIDSFIRSYEK